MKQLSVLSVLIELLFVVFFILTLLYVIMCRQAKKLSLSLFVPVLFLYLSLVFTSCHYSLVIILLPCFLVFILVLFSYFLVFISFPYFLGWYYFLCVIIFLWGISFYWFLVVSSCLCIYLFCTSRFSHFIDVIASLVQCFVWQLIAIWSLIALLIGLPISKIRATDVLLETLCHLASFLAKIVSLLRRFRWSCLL